MEPGHSELIQRLCLQGHHGNHLFSMQLFLWCLQYQPPSTNKNTKSQRRRKGGPKTHPGGEQKEGTEASLQIRGKKKEQRREIGSRNAECRGKKGKWRTGGLSRQRQGWWERSRQQEWKAENAIEEMKKSRPAEARWWCDGNRSNLLENVAKKHGENGKQKCNALESLKKDSGKNEKKNKDYKRGKKDTLFSASKTQLNKRIQIKIKASICIFKFCMNLLWKNCLCQYMFRVKY